MLNKEFNLKNLPKYWMVEIDEQHPFFKDFASIWESFDVKFGCNDYRYLGYDRAIRNSGYHGCNDSKYFLNNAILLSMDDFQQLVTKVEIPNINYSIF